MRMNPLTIVVLCLLAALLVACQDSTPPTGRTSPGLSVTEILGSEDNDGFARATQPCSFEFPRDHGPHPTFKTEWWYYTGNLHNAAGRRFGYQLTFFRNALQDDEDRKAPHYAELLRKIALGSVTGDFKAYMIKVAKELTMREISLLAELLVVKEFAA